MYAQRDQRTHKTAKARISEMYVAVCRLATLHGRIKRVFPLFRCVEADAAATADAAAATRAATLCVFLVPREADTPTANLPAKSGM